MEMLLFREFPHADNNHWSNWSNHCAHNSDYDRFLVPETK